MSNEAKDLEAFRQEVRAWLKANLPEGWGTPEYVTPDPASREAHDLSKWWTKKSYDAGYTGFGVPKEYGGIERPPEEIAIIRQEMARTGIPGAPSVVSLGIALPTILGWGQEWQKKRFVPKIISGEEAWVQGFSEPNAGSDLANVQTTAVRDGDEWVVNGQKVWNSGAHFADYGLLVVKTDPTAPRHRNLSYFIFDCKSPGFSFRPLIQMSGASEFCEMFFDDMRIPHENLIGELNKGWYVAMTTLGAERNMIGGGMGGVSVGSRGSRILGSVDSIIELARNTRRRGRTVWEDPAFRQKIAQTAIEDQAMRYSIARTAARVRKGIPPGPEVSVAKNFSSELQQRRMELAMEIIGAYSQLVKGSSRALNDGQWVFNMLSARGITIAGGTSEINRNIIAERVLGLPR